MRRFLTPAPLALIALLLLGVEVARPAGDGEDADREGTAGSPPLVETSAVSRHTVTLDGATIAYTATAGTLLLEDDAGQTRASIFSIAYVRAGIEDPAERPVTFCFNGGPGAAALWVHLGAFGPRKVLADEEGFPLPPPGRLVDNPHSILGATDLVFIDPPSTGLSRPAPGAAHEELHGLRADVAAMGDFIRLWLTRNERWASPKFLAGESYGTTRAAGLALHLQGEHGIFLNGVVMISTVLNWLNSELAVGNDMPYIIYLPSYAAAAWYHGKLPAELAGRDLPEVLAEVERFALGDYALALLQGDRLDGAQRRLMADRLARYTGLPAPFVERANLRVDLGRFRKELLRDAGWTVGRLDGRFTGRDLDAAGEAPEFDASLTAVSIGYVELMNDYLRRELGYESDLAYRSLARQVRPWAWEDQENRYANLAEELRQAMVRNPSLQVLFAAGYYDFATPYFDTPYTVAHMGLPPELRDHVAVSFYEAGHMMYIRDVDHDRLRRDVEALIARATTPAVP